MIILYLGVISCEVDAIKQVNEVENNLKIEPTNDIFENITEASLNAAAKIFLYIYPEAKHGYCLFSIFNSWFRVWSTFYHDLFKTQSADKIILTLNRIIKTTSHQLSRNAAEDILTRAATILSLKYQFIQSRLPQNKSKSADLEDSQFVGNSDGKFEV